MQKTYSLALWWGAAKWICHIGVIRFIEENDIQIHEVAGTSMGAVIAACFALWMSSQEMEKKLKEIHFLKLIDINFVEWMVSGNKVMKELEKIFWKTQIQDVDIPLKIVATDIQSWEKKVLDRWSIVDAIRASISLPLIFKAHTIEWQILVDGGLKENLPILELQGNDIIAVSAIRNKNTIIETHTKIWHFEFKKNFFEYNYQIMRNTLALTMMTNEDLHLDIAQTQWKKVLLVAPDMWKFEYYDFLKVSEIAQAWYEEMKKVSYQI